MDITPLLEKLILSSEDSSDFSDLSNIQNAPIHSFFDVDEIIFDDNFTLPPNFKIQEDYHVFPSHPIDLLQILHFLLQFEFYHIPHHLIRTTIQRLEIIHIGQKIKDL